MLDELVTFVQSVQDERLRLSVAKVHSFQQLIIMHFFEKVGGRAFLIKHSHDFVPVSDVGRRVVTNASEKVDAFACGKNLLDPA